LRSFTRLLLVAAVVFTVAATAFPSGFQLFEQGSKAQAMGGAFVATADDPSAIFYNVAGIAQQRHAQFLAGTTAITFSNQFSGDPTSEFTSGTTGYYRRHTFTLPNAYVVVPIGQNLTFGVGVMTPFGLRTNWQNPWVGRFIASDSNIKTFGIEPALAWQTSDGRFAIGGGAEYRRARITLQRNNPFPGAGVDPFTGRIVDVANVYLTSDWESAWTWNAGVLFKPSDRFRVGLSYRGGVDMKFKGNATFTQISTGNAQLDALVKAGLPPNQPISTTLPMPATAMLGVAFYPVPSWDVEADITRTSWSSFKSLSVAFAQTPQVNLFRPEDWKDTYSYRLGTNHPVTADWDVRLGLVYDQNPQPVSAVTPLLPDADREGVSFGVGYHPGPHWVVDGSVFALHFKQRSTQGQNLEGFNGTYKTDAALMSLSLGYRF